MKLVLFGFMQTSPQLAPATGTQSGIGSGTLFGGLMLFVGFDLGTRRHEQTRELVCIWAMLVGLGLWGAVSLYFVPSKRLADTFIPYSLATRSIGGQTGRLLISLE